MHYSHPIKEDLIAKGWRKATLEQVAKAKAKITATKSFKSLDAGDWCYSGPCNDGGLTCYIDENGNCDDCYHDPLCD